MSLTDRLPIIGRLTPDDRATFGRYHNVKSADCRVILARRFTDDTSPENLRMGERNLGASTKSRRPTKKINQIGPDFAWFSKFLLTGRRSLGLGNVTVALFIERHICVHRCQIITSQKTILRNCQSLDFYNKRLKPNTTFNEIVFLNVCLAPF